MIVLVLTAAPSGLRGDLTKWLMEISPGVFVGRVNPRVREKLWDRVTAMGSHGRALLVFTDSTEQGLSFKVHDHDWNPTDLEGLTAMKRPTRRRAQGRSSTWSAARAQKRARHAPWARRYEQTRDDETTSESS